MIKWGSFRPTLDQVFAQACDDCIGPLPDVWVVTYGRRSQATQAVLFADWKAGTGGMAAPPGESAHEWGLAIDVGLQLSPGGSLTWDVSHPAFARLWAAILASPHLHSGHSFPADTGGKVAADDDHVESTTWLAKRAELKAAGTWGVTT